MGPGITEAGKAQMKRLTTKADSEHQTNRTEANTVALLRKQYAETPAGYT